MGVGGREGYKWEPAGLSEAVTAPTSHLLILSSSSSISSEVGWHYRRHIDTTSYGCFHSITLRNTIAVLNSSDTQ